MIKVKSNRDIDKIHNDTIQILKDILNDAIASKKFTKTLLKKGEYKTLEILQPRAFIMRRLKHIK